MRRSSWIRVVGIAGLVSLGLIWVLFVFVSPRSHRFKAIFPIPTPTPTPEWSLEELAASELAKLTEGRIVFNPPTTMQQGQEERIEARISSEDIGARLTEGLKGRGLPEVEAVKVGSLMKVSLHAEADEFRITALSSEEQIVSGRPFAQWNWTVTPLDYGAHSLHLIATANVVIPGLGEKSVDIPVIDRTINVKVSPGYIVKGIVRNPTTWQIVFGGGAGVLLLTGIFAAIQRYRTKKKKKIVPGFVPPKPKPMAEDPPPKKTD